MSIAAKHIFRMALASVALTGVAPVMAQQLPAVKLLTAPLVTPSAAWSYYGTATTHTNGVAAWSARPAEIKELAIALGKGRYTADNYANNVYEYIRNNIKTEFRFGLAKGARGAVIDQSGTPFDQAHLMVELLREGGVTANYQVGTASLTADQFGKWTGFVTGLNQSAQTFSVNAKAACQFLADGGIPATINGATACTSLSGNLATSGTPIVMGHAWVQATIGSTTKYYDPSFKTNILKTGTDLAAAMGCGTEATQNCSSTILSNTGNLDLAGKTLAGDPTRQGRIDGQMNTYAKKMQQWIQDQNNSNKTNLLLEDVVGGPALDTSAAFAAGATLPFTMGALYTWSEIPNQFRTTLRVRIDQIDTTLFVDEYYGRNLRLIQPPTAIGTTTSVTRYMTLYLDTTPVATRSVITVTSEGANLFLDVNHPYAANGGVYADDALAQWITDLTFNTADKCSGPWVCSSTGWVGHLVTIVQSWGDTTESTTAHFAALIKRDAFSFSLDSPSNPNHLFVGRSKADVYNQSHALVYSVDRCFGGDATGITSQPRINPGCREDHQSSLAVNWHAEVSRLWYLASQISQGAAQQHHHLGVVVSGQSYYAESQSEAQTVLHATNLISVQSAVSVNSRTAALSNRTALFTSATQAMSRLEGGALEQMFDAWEGGSASSLLVRSNQKGYAFVELHTSTDMASLSSYSDAQKAVILNYLNNNYTVTAPQIGTLSYPWTVEGQSIDASFDFNGIIAENGAASSVAYVAGQYEKGAGAASSDDPTKSVLDSVKVAGYSQSKQSYGVTLQSASLSFTPAADLTTGNGSFPMSLTFQRRYNSAASIDAKDCDAANTGDLQSEPEFVLADLGGGWSHNWSISARAGTDAMAGLGRDSALNASAAIAGLYVTAKLNAGTRTMRERLATVFANNSWVQGLQNNVVIVNRPPNTTVFVRLPDGVSFNAGPASTDRLTEGGVARTLVGPRKKYGTTTLWNFSGITYSLIISDGSIIQFKFGRSYNNLPLSASSSISSVFGPEHVGFWVPDWWQFPSGVKLSFSYTYSPLANLWNRDSYETAYAYPSIPGYHGWTKDQNNLHLCLSSVSNNLGRSLNFDCSTLLSTVTDDSGRTVKFSSDTFTTSGSGKNMAPLCRPSKFYVTDAENQVTRYEYLQKPTTAIERDYPKIYQWFLPWDSNPFMNVGYDSLFRVKTLTDNSASPAVTNYFSSGLYGSENQKRGEIQDAVGGVTTKYFDANGNVTALIDPLGMATYSSYDSARRLTKTTYPEGNAVSYTYDARSNLLTTTQHPKSGSVLPNIVSETKTYVEGPTIGTCTNQATCNLVASATDSKGNITSYTYNQAGSSPTAQLLQIKGPAISGGNATTNYCYNNYTPSGGGTITLLTGKVELASSGVNRVASYAYNSGNKYVLSTSTVDPSTTLTPVAGSPFCTGSAKSGALNLTTTFAFDGVGNVTSVADARGNTAAYMTNYYWDKMRRLTRADSPPIVVNGSSMRPVTRYTYDTWGQLKSKRRRITSGAITDPDPNIAWPEYVGSGLVATDWQTEWREYYPNGDLKSVTDAENHTVNYAYDKVGRQTLVTDADGRRTGTVYDLAGQTTCLWKAWDSTTAPTNCTWSPSTYTSSGNAGKFRYAAYTYTNNGKQKTVQDANNNQTDYVYDKHDRSRFTFYPDPSTGNRCTAPSGETGAPTCPTGATYEELWYTADGSTGAARCSANGQPCRKRLRNGQTITYNTYDAMDRLITKTPQGQGAVSYGYNLLSQPTSISEAASGSYAAHTTTYAYDGAGRKGSETNDGRTVWYLYDNAGNRTRTVWPDNYYVTYDYDALNRMTYVKENGTTEIGFYDYDILSRRSKLRFAGNESNRSTYFYEADNDLDVLTQLMNATTVTLDYGHNNAGQITGIAANDDFYLPKPTVSFSHAYVPDKLNRYSSVKGTAATYDNNGNLLTRYPLNGTTKDTFTYDSENRLVTAAVNGSSTATISYDYDALGRRVKKTVGTTVTQYLLDGDEEIAELNSTGTVLRRYITGPAIDDRIARAEGSATSNPTKTYYRTNHQGSVVATTDAAGTVTQRLAYDEYGLLGQGGVPSGEQFRYTGRRYDPETNLYYYRARYYAPDIGRFLQVDPVGYKDDFNLYTYTRNDPVNRFDPGGDDSYLVARRLDSFIGRLGYGHSYVVSNATRVGDPNATIHSYGKLANGNMGSVNDPTRAADVSKTTFQSDADNWRSLAPSTTTNVVKIDAPDKTVDAVAGSVKENTPYALNPSSSSETPETNSNSAAFAVGDKAQQLATGKSNSVVNDRPIDLTLPGASAAGKVTFQCTKAMQDIGGCK